MDRFELLKLIMLTAREGVAVYVKGEKTYCPVCVALGVNLVAAKIQRTDGKVRFFACPQCLNTFKAIEKDPDPIPVVVIQPVEKLEKMIIDHKPRRRKRVL